MPLILGCRNRFQTPFISIHHVLNYNYSIVTYIDNIYTYMYMYIDIYIYVHVYIYKSIYKYIIHNTYTYMCMWGFPEIGVPLVIIHF